MMLLAWDTVPRHQDRVVLAQRLALYRRALVVSLRFSLLDTVRAVFLRQTMPYQTGFFFFKILFNCLFLEGMEGEREGEKHQCMVASHAPPTGDLACHPGMWPYWESNQQPFGSQACAQAIELHQAGPDWHFNCPQSLGFSWPSCGWVSLPFDSYGALGESLL